MEARPSLIEPLEGLHDPRRARGERHPSALLGLAVVGLLAGRTRSEAIVPSGKEPGWDSLPLLGFTTGWGLGQATDARAFRRIDVADFGGRVGHWIGARRGRDDAPPVPRWPDRPGPSRRRHAGVHRVSASAPDVKAVPAPPRVDAKAHEHKAALQLLGVVPPEGQVSTGDARFAHRDVRAAVLGGGAITSGRPGRISRRSAGTSRPPSPRPRPALPPLRAGRAGPAARGSPGRSGCASPAGRPRPRWWRGSPACLASGREPGDRSPCPEATGGSRPAGTACGMGRPGRTPAGSGGGRQRRSWRR